MVCGRAGDRCEVCGALGGAARIDVHEVWSFQQGKRPVQRLERVVALCVDCRRTQYVHRAGDDGGLDLVVCTLMEVNRWPFEWAVRNVRQADSGCLLRRATGWDLDLSVLDGLIAIEGYPGLYVPFPDRHRLGDVK